jgi:hypothetical protein
MIDGPVVNATDYGAAADWNGSTGTDNTAAFTAAVTALGTLGGGTLLISPGNYKGKLKLNRSNIKVLAYGAVVGFTAEETLTIEPPLGATNYGPFLAFAPASNVPIAPAVGAVFMNITLATQGSRAVTVDSASTVNAGDYCMMISGTSPIATPSTNYVPETCQTRKVIGVSGNDVWFDEPNDATITGASEHPYLIKWDFVENITVEGLTINNFYGAAYCVSFGGAINTSFKNVTFNPASAWGAFASCRNTTFDHCTVNNAYTGFSSARMTDETTFINCTVSCTDTDLSLSQNYFYFGEENVKRVSLLNCAGIDAGVFFYGGNSYSNITITDSKFDVFKPGVSAFRLTTFSAGIVSSTNTTYVSRGGIASDPWDEVPNATCEVAYAPTGVTFNNCEVIQLAVGSQFGYNHGSVQQPYTSNEGVVFPLGHIASTNASTLDEYLEVSFTPTFTGFVFGGVLTIHRAECIKIGRMVTEIIEISDSVSIASISTGSNIRSFPIDPAYEVPGIFCKGLTAITTPYVRAGDFGYSPTFMAGAAEHVTFSCTYFTAT